MNTIEVTEPLETASRAIADGEAQIAHQRTLIARLEATAEDTGEACALLNALVRRQAERLQNLAAIIRSFLRQR
jgi:hypothetical protein